MGLITGSSGTGTEMLNHGDRRLVRSEYHVDMWRCVRKRWMVAGVLAALALAVLAPRAGAQGGILHAEYVWYVLLSYIYFSAGRRGVRRVGARLLLVCCAHAALVAPALAVLLLAGTAHSHVHYSLVQGVLISSVGSGCGWLSLALCADAGAAPVSAATYLVSLLTTPLAMLLLCGRCVVPAPSAVAGTCAWAVAAFGAGAGAVRLVPAPPPPARGASEAAKVCALALLYMECCEALALRGSVRLEDMLAVLLLETSWLAMSAAACWGYARCGLLAPRDARLVALCALPKGPHQEWHTGAACMPAALARLPGVLLAPAQALLLAALAAHADCTESVPVPGCGPVACEWHTGAACMPAALARLPGVLLAPAQALLLAALAAHADCTESVPVPGCGPVACGV